MEGLQIGGCLHRALSFRSKTLLCSCSLPLLLLLLLLVVSPGLPPHWENPMLPTVYWHALSGLCEAPAFAFLLLNCLIVTTIASSKLQSEKRGGQERESARSVLERDDAKSAYHIVAENVVGQTHNSSAKYADDIMCEGKQFLRSSCSLDAHYKREIRQEPVSFDLINDEKKPIRRARLACRGSRHNSNKSLSSSLREKKLMRGSFSLNEGGSHDGKPALQEELGDIEKSIKRPGHPGNIIDRQPRQASNSTAAAATAHSPSLEEVWKAIVLSNKGDDAMVCMQADQKCCNDIPPQPAADTDALSPPAAAAAAPSPAAHSPQRATKDAPAKAQGRATMKQERGDDQESDSETLEELNRRAEEFIARFNRQMRLQRQESLQRQRGLRACTQYDLQRPHHLQLPVRGLLVGT